MSFLRRSIRSIVCMRMSGRATVSPVTFSSAIPKIFRSADSSSSSAVTAFEYPSSMISRALPMRSRRIAFWRTISAWNLALAACGTRRISSLMISAPPIRSDSPRRFSSSSRIRASTGLPAS